MILSYIKMKYIDGMGNFNRLNNNVDLNKIKIMIYLSRNEDEYSYYTNNFECLYGTWFKVPYNYLKNILNIRI